MQKSSIIELLDRKNEILDDIKNIEENCEGTRNSLNKEKIYHLSEEQANLTSQKSMHLNKLSEIDSRLRSINSKIRTLSGEGIDKILDAINEQRWFFFKNKPKVIMDRFTGILWANLDYFDFYNVNSESHTFSFEEALEVVDNLDLNSYKNWTIPTVKQLITMIDDKTFPFQEGNCHRIKNLDYWFALEGDTNCLDLDNYNRNRANVYLLPCNTSLTNDEYAKSIMDNKIYSQTEKTQFTLNMFISNGLEPIFNDDWITQLYHKVYIEKPSLLQEYEVIKKEIAKHHDNSSVSSAFDFSTLIEEFDLNSINASIIKYYKAVKKWVDTIVEMLDFFESEKIDLVKNFKKLKLETFKAYEPELEMSDDENLLFGNRRDFIRKIIDFDIKAIKRKLLSVRKNADDIELKLDDINRGDNIIEDLAKLEKTERVSFELMAEYTIDIVKTALAKAEYFEKNKRVLTSLINIENSWADDYKMLKIKFKNKFRIICEKESIDGISWSSWYRDWYIHRYAVEMLFLPLMQRELTSTFKDNNSIAEDIVSVVEKILNSLQLYKDNIDDFYTNERKRIYSKFEGMLNKEAAENAEVENELNKLHSYLKGNIENIVSSLKSIDDKMFIQKWIKPLVNIKI
jgi:hypothetical protein